MENTTVRLCVGGATYVCARSTLLRHSDSFFAKLLSGAVPTARDDTGALFIDRDGTHFRYILNYLRDGSVCLPPDDPLLRQVAAEWLSLSLAFMGVELAAVAERTSATRSVLERRLSRAMHASSALATAQAHAPGAKATACALGAPWSPMTFVRDLHSEAHGQREPSTPSVHEEDAMVARVRAPKRQESSVDHQTSVGYE